MNEKSYHLGASASEQDRLHRQRVLYGDTQEIRFNPSDCVCEFGCGPLSNYWIAEMLSEGTFIGVDSSPLQIEAASRRAKQLGLPNVTLFAADGRATGLPGESVDASFARCVLIHLPEPKLLLKEMLRITRPNGRIILIEPHDPTYYVSPDKPNLLKCYRARDYFAYFNCRGSPDVALNLYTFLSELGVRDIRIKPHIIFSTGAEPERCKLFLENWLGLIQPVISSLINEGAVTESEWKAAQAEGESVSRETFLYQSMWIAEARKC